ncbi:MAG TPA: SIR2 family protein [Nitrososphaeraceae archaeon]|nr:SIR2 family protein [Nitrososphaeraceae archaeon]
MKFNSEFLKSINEINVSPPNVVRIALATNSLLFIGYSMDDCYTRMLFSHLMDRSVMTSREIAVLVQQPDFGRYDIAGRTQKYMN